jgi:alpha-glucosidase
MVKRKITILNLTTLILISAFSLIQSCSKIVGADYHLTSPDGDIGVKFNLSREGNVTYRVACYGREVILASQLGIIREDADFANGLILDSISAICPVNYEYAMPQGKKRQCNYTGNERFFYFTNSTGLKMNIIFRVANDGVAFRYNFPEQSNGIKTINEEISEFHFPPQTKAFIQPMEASKSGWCQVNPGYEEYYQQGVLLEELPYSVPGWAFPALFQEDDFWLLISETAPDRNYCGCRLQQDTTNQVFHIDFPQPAEVFPGGVLKPTSTLPWSSPWRIITIGKGLKNIVESTLGTDLAEPARLSDISYVKPGRSSWSWVLLKDDSTVFEVQKRFIEYAAGMHWEYCLVDADWDRKIGYEKLGELATYAKSRNVGIIVWYNSSGDWNTTTYSPKSKLLSHADRLKEFGRLKAIGISGIKVDFFGGDGQSMMAYYQDIFEDAAEFGLLVNCHGATLSRGWQRTYPNLLTMEAVRGFEYITFEQGNADHEPNHACMLPFTRNVFDPMDFTPVCFSEVPNIKRVTTNGFELATAVIFWSGIQHFAETPRGMAAVPDYIKTFMREVPVVWDETRFIEGFPGKLVVLARRVSETWYVAGINGENIEKTLSLSLPFLKENRNGALITDGDDNRSFSTREITVVPGKQIELSIRGNGGFVIKFED